MWLAWSKWKTEKIDNKGPMSLETAQTIHRRGKFSGEKVEMFKWEISSIWTNAIFVDWRAFYFPRAAVTNCDKLGSLWTQKLILSEFWRPEVQNQGVSMATLPLKALGENPFLPFSAPCGSSQASLGYSSIIPISALVFTLPSSLCPLCVLFCLL